jgi:hypothetical protein
MSNSKDVSMDKFEILQQQHQTETSPSSAPTFASLDHSKMIPIRDGAQGQPHFYMHLTGSALSRTYAIWFDTGALRTAIPNSHVDRSQVRTIRTAAQGSNHWVDPADLVEGQLCVASTDATTTYCLDNYRFFAKEFGTIVMGAMPNLYDEDLPSFPTALAAKYASGSGYGIVSTGNGQDIDAN